MTPDERKKFLADHRLCIVAYERTDGPPAQSVVYYAMDGDDLIISTTASRAKAKAIARDPRVSVCVIAEAMPFPYLTVYGRGRIEDTQVVETMMKVGERMTGNPIPDSARPTIEKRARDERRVVLRVTPTGFSP